MIAYYKGRISIDYCMVKDCANRVVDTKSSSQRSCCMGSLTTRATYAAWQSIVIMCHLCDSSEMPAEHVRIAGRMRLHWPFSVLVADHRDSLKTCPSDKNNKLALW